MRSTLSENTWPKFLCNLGLNICQNVTVKPTASNPWGKKFIAEVVFKCCSVSLMCLALMSAGSSAAVWLPLLEVWLRSFNDVNCLFIMVQW